MKKILLGLGAAGITLAMIPLFAAFEAHVVNVTAQIENALSVSTEAIDFGTVFPQEHLYENLEVTLSGSFMTEDRVDDVSYFIRQKPKCGWTLNNGTNLLGLPTATGHVYAGIDTNQTPYTTQYDGYYVVCPDPGSPLRPNGAVYGVLPSLCPYISKEADSDVPNDETTPSFHQPWTVVDGQIVYTDTDGYLTKDGGDTTDNWTIDLAVPCFGGYCAQDWANYVLGINDRADPALYTQDIDNEHKVFGCDLWVEVSDVSEAIEGPTGLN